jgi:hypothetical protein
MGQFWYSTSPYSDFFCLTMWLGTRFLSHDENISVQYNPQKSVAHYFIHLLVLYNIVYLNTDHGLE